MTRRRAWIEALKARAEAIRTDDGFTTDAGANVTINEIYALGENEDDPAVAIGMLIEPDAPQGRQGEHVRLRTPVKFVAVAKGTGADASLAAEDVLGDIKKAIEQTDRTFGRLIQQEIERGGTETLEREAGHTFVGVVITYYVNYAERWGYPEV